MRPAPRPGCRTATLAALAALVGASACASRAPTAPPFPAPGGPRPPEVRSESAAASALVATAVALVGTPYRPGGQAPGTGFDCSGFVLWVFGQHGLHVPRTVTGLFEAGDRLNPGTSPAAADLVFFDTEGHGPSHVGIALGNGWFVHAPSSRGVVRVDALAGAYWAERYRGARRLLRAGQARGTT